MAAQNLTQSALVAVQVKLNEFIAGQNPTMFGRMEPGFVFGALAQRSYANSRIIRDNAGRCVAFESHWLKDSGITASIATSAPAVGCDQTATDGLVSAKKSYQPNLFATSKILLDDDTCGTLFDTPSFGLPESERGAELVSEALVQLMQKNRSALDEELITRLNTNRQTDNYDNNLAPYVSWDGTNDVYNLDSFTRFATPDTLTDIDAILQNNDILQYFLLGGRNAFYNAIVNSQFRQENDNERFLRRFGTVAIANDIRRMDAKLNTLDSSSGNTYLFGIADGSYVMGNFSYFNDVPVQLIRQENPTFVFRIPDPIIQINQEGRLQPLYHDVIHTTKCGSSDGRGIPTALHEFTVMTKMLFDVAPTDTAGRTGILKFKAPVGV